MYKLIVAIHCYVIIGAVVICITKRFVHVASYNTPTDKPLMYELSDLLHK